MNRHSRWLGPLAPILALSLAHRRLLTFAFALCLGQSATALAMPWLAGRLATRFAASPDASAGASLALLFGLFALVALHALAAYGGESAVAKAESSMAADLRHRLYAHLQSLPLPLARRRPPGQALELLAVDVEAAATFASHAPVAAPPAALTLIGVLVCLATLDPWLPVWFACAAPPLWWSVRRLGRPLSNLSARLAGTHGRLLDMLQENLSNLATIKTYRREERELRRAWRLDRAVRNRRDAQMRRHVLVAPVTHVAGAGACAGLVAIAAAAPVGVRLLPGELVAALLYGMVLMRALGSVAEIHVQVQHARSAARRLSGVWSQPSECEAATTPTSPPLRGDVEIRGLHFRHPGSDATLCGLDLRLRAGEVVALVGPNGAGKTTLAELLVGFHSPVRGAVRIDGRDVTAIPRDELRRQVVLAAQDTQLFARSIRDNIAFGRPHASDGEIRDAAERAGGAEFIERLPDGYSTRIGDADRRLSGGQRQRIALARALLCDPRVLILDEATSMFDAEGEIAFLRRNRDWLRQRTTLLITHRPDSVAFADRVATLRDGRITPTPRELPHAAPQTSSPNTP